MKQERYVLRLYVANCTPSSRLAIENIKAIVEERLKDRYDLEVIDLEQHPEQAREQEIVAVPTLIKELPPPLKRLVGNLAQEEKVLVGLNLLPKHANG